MLVARSLAFVKDSARVNLAALALVPLVSIQAPGAEEGQLAAAVEGCNQALGEGRCAAGPTSPESAWRATIFWSDAARRRAHVQLARSGEVGDGVAHELVTREVEFGSEDPLEHRYRAVGLIIAAYLVASGASEEKSSAPPAPAPVPPVPPRDPSSALPEVRRRSWGLDGLVTLGSGFADERLVAGAALRPWWRLPEGPLFLLGQARWRSFEERVKVDWMSVSLGLGVALESPTFPVHAELRLEAVAEHVGLRARQAHVAASESAGVWRFGGRAGVDGVAAFGERWAFVVGGDVELVRPTLRVDVAGQRAGEERPWAAQGVLGLRYRID